MTTYLRHHPADGITALRILCAGGLVCFSPQSAAFWTMYLVGGLSDMVDGIVARRTGSVSRFGTMLDSAADFAFFVVVAGKIVPTWELPWWLWLWAALIAVLRLYNLLWSVQRFHRAVFLHTAADRVTGVLLFLLPLAVKRFGVPIPGGVTATAALFAAWEEGYRLRSGEAAKDKN